MQSKKGPKKEKIEYGAQFIPLKHKERGTNMSNGYNYGRQTMCDSALGGSSNSGLSKK